MSNDLLQYFQSAKDGIDQKVAAKEAAVDAFIAGSMSFSIYVDITGDDITGDGSSAKPYATIAKATDSGPSGSYIIIHLANEQNHSLDADANIVSKVVRFISRGGQAGVASPSRPGDDAPTLVINSNFRLLNSLVTFGQNGRGIKVKMNGGSFSTSVTGGGDSCPVSAVSFAHSSIELLTSSPMTSSNYGIKFIRMRTSDFIKTHVSGLIADLSLGSIDFNVSTMTLSGAADWAELFAGVDRAADNEPRNVTANVLI